MAERLYELAREYAGLTGERDRLRPLLRDRHDRARRSRRDALTVWGVEVSEESVACAIENADLNGIANAAFFAGDVGRRARGAARARRRARTWWSSTRRAPGSPGKALRRLGALEAPRIVYVSCNPTTLAGDVKELARTGLHARARAAGRHVPAHAARRERSRSSRAERGRAGRGTASARRERATPVGARPSSNATARRRPITGAPSRAGSPERGRPLRREAMPRSRSTMRRPADRAPDQVRVRRAGTRSRGAAAPRGRLVEEDGRRDRPAERRSIATT